VLILSEIEGLAIFIIASSHHALFKGASIYAEGDYVTPLGKAKVDTKLGKKLISENKIFGRELRADAVEHAIEVEVPFLQYILGNELNLIPILMGTQDEDETEEVAKALKPYFTTDNLFVVSSDMSHYPDYEDAQKSDEKMAKAISSNSPKTFIRTIHDIENSNIQNLATAACGWTSILTLLNMTSDIKNVKYEVISSKNSGDSYFGEKSRVVGYLSVAVTNEEKADVQEDFLTPKDKKELLKIARQTIEQYISYKTTLKVDEEKLSKGLLTPCGAFVTLREKGDLRGCIGNFSGDKALYLTVQEMAVAAATHDYRFDPVRKDEIDKIKLDISVLTPMRKINSIDEIVLGKHGVYIKKGNRSGTFLPQVYDETHWTKEEFLGHCAQDKAGIGWDGWKDADIFVYEAIVFGE
jgi:AmmeMemoRadiSam system protein A/AmmeMemoRadiSam system protein B